jgi:hypothetical protein
MSETTSEQQLVDQARTALLEGIVKAAKAGEGDTARALADAYDIVSATTPEAANDGPGFVTGDYRMSMLRGRR